MAKLVSQSISIYDGGKACGIKPSDQIKPCRPDVCAASGRLKEAALIPWLWEEGGGAILSSMG